MTPRSGRSLRDRRRVLTLVLLACLPWGCAERIGQKAAEGAMKSMREEAANPTGRPASEIAAERAVQGAMKALDDPEQQARIQKMISAAVAAVTRTMVEDASAQLMAELGPNGSGPLAVSMSQAGQRVSASVAGGVVGGVVGGMETQLASLVPECSGPNRAACLQQRLQETTRTTAASFSRGVRDSIGWQFLLLAFALGAVGGALGSWLWSLRTARRSWRTA
jgi:hypothetical protein